MGLRKDLKRKEEETEKEIKKIRDETLRSIREGNKKLK